MDGWLTEWIDGWLTEWIDGWLTEWIDDMCCPVCVMMHIKEPLLLIGKRVYSLAIWSET